MNLNELLISFKTRKQIERHHGLLDFRPTVVACIQNSQNRILIAESEHGSKFFIQGGIESGESLTKALRREVREEVGLTSLFQVRHLFTHKLEYLPNRPKRGDFSEGKAYFVCSARVETTGALLPRTKELKRAWWVDPRELKEVTREMEEEKAGLVVQALLKLGYRVYPQDFHQDL